MTREAALKALEEYRHQIDAVDLRILVLLNERTRIVERIGAVKQQAGLPIYEPRREDQVYQNVTGNNTGPLMPEAVQRIFERIIDEMRVVQRVRMEQSSVDGDPSC